MKTLVIAEHAQGQLKPATRNTLTAAEHLQQPVILLIAGDQCQSLVAEAQTLAGISEIWVCDAPYLAPQLAEDVTAIILANMADISAVLAPATSQGKNLIPRLAALLDVQPLSDVQAIISPTRFERPIYAGNVIATVETTDACRVMTIRTTAFDPVTASGAPVAVKSLAALQANDVSRWVNDTVALSERPELTAASVVVSGGRGLGSSENFALLFALADKLGGAVGASRAAVDAGFVSNDLQVGQTGKIVAPNLYIAAGISGAIQHLAGMKESKVIVAINKDPEAPIFQVADYGLVADLFTAVPELTAKL